MAQTGYTPILIYSSSTASQAPAAGNLTNSTLGSELAINITDGKLFYKDNANAVQVIGWKTTPTTAGGTGLTSYAAGDLLYYASGTTLSKLAIGTSGQWLGSSGSAPQWNSPAALTKTDDTNVTLTLGGSASTALLNAASLTLGWTGQLAVTRGGTGLSGLTANRVLYASATNTVGTSANFTYNGTDLTVTGGNFVVGTSGKGVDFSATPGTGISELLADYEEGTWTPVFEAENGAFGAITYNSLNGGRYIKVGNVVHIQALIYTDSVNIGTATLEVRIGGLPFTSVTSTSGKQDGFSSIAVSQTSNWVTNQPTGALVRANSTQVGLYYRTTANGASNVMTVSEVTTGSTGNLLRIAGTYIAA